MKVKTVFAVSVRSKHVFSDFFQWFRNLLGMNLVAYEQMIEDSVEEALYKLYQSYPDVYDVKITTSMTTMGASEVIVYGKVRVIGENKKDD